MNFWNRFCEVGKWKSTIFRAIVLNISATSRSGAVIQDALVVSRP